MRWEQSHEHDPDEKVVEGDRSFVGVRRTGVWREMVKKRKEGAILRKLVQAIGTFMVLVGLGLVALFLVGPPGGTAGSVPTGGGGEKKEGTAGGTLHLSI